MVGPVRLLPVAMLGMEFMGRASDGADAGGTPRARFFSELPRRRQWDPGGGVRRSVTPYCQDHPIIILAITRCAASPCIARRWHPVVLERRLLGTIATLCLFQDGSSVTESKIGQR